MYAIHDTLFKEREILNTQAWGYSLFLIKMLP